MKRQKRATKETKFNLTVAALQGYLKSKGEHMGFLRWQKVNTTQNHRGEDEFCNVTVKGVAIMENYNRGGIEQEVPVHFTYSQDSHMNLSFRDEG